MRWLRRLYITAVPASLKFILKRMQFRVAPRPMMSKDERAVIRALLLTGRFARVVELGAGGSTLYFPKYLPPGGEWWSFEFDKRWYRFLSQRVPKQVRLNRVGSLEEIESLAGDALTAADLILIDGGPDRAAAIRFVAQRCAMALVLLHDAGRPRYEAAKRSFAAEIVLSRGYAPPPTPSHEAGGLSLLLQPGLLPSKNGKGAAPLRA